MAHRPMLCKATTNKNEPSPRKVKLHASGAAHAKPASLARNDELHNATPCQHAQVRKINKRAQRSAPLRYATRSACALRCTLRCALRTRALRAVLRLRAGPRSALRSRSATQCCLANAIDFVLPPPHHPALRMSTLPPPQAHS